MTHEEPAPYGGTVEAALRRAPLAGGPAMEPEFTSDEWAMSPEEFRYFWRNARMSSVSTLGAGGRLHASPLEVTLQGHDFVLPTFANAVRSRDVESNRHVVITTWDDPYHIAIVYGDARIEDRAASATRILVKPQRIYAIRAPYGHPAHRLPAFNN